MLDQLTVTDFQKLEGIEIELIFDGHRHSGSVVEASQHTGGMVGGRAPFSVIVRCGPTDRHWPQGTYTLVHPDFGDLDLFMVPIGPDHEGMCYQISFS